MGKLEGYFDGDLGLRKGDIIRIRKGILEGQFIRATDVENVTANTTQVSDIDWTRLNQSPVAFEPVITGRVEGADFFDRTTSFSLSTGVYLPDNRFFPAGSFEEGQDVLRRLLAGETGGYVKVVDPYTTPETLDLLASVRKGTSIMVLGDTKGLGGNAGASRTALRDKAKALRLAGTDIEVRLDPTGGLHDRYIMTGSGVWSVGHSLKDFGKKDTSLARLQDAQPLEGTFDRRWDTAERL